MPRIYLTPIEAAAVPILKWLISEDHTTIATGRTFVLAYVFIETAIENEGRKVEVWDHIPTVQGRINMMRVIEYVWDQLKDDRYILVTYKEDMTIVAKLITDNNGNNDNPVVKVNVAKPRGNPHKGRGKDDPTKERFKFRG